MSTQLSKISQLTGQRQLLLEQKSDALKRYDYVSAQIDIAEQSKSHFKAIKDASDQNAVELYSELLTSIVHDVMMMPDQKVELTTDVVRGKTALQINTFKHGHKESIDNARGGSINNLVAAGLRFISLYKSSNRRFVMLDEAECWLEQSLIPRFVSVIEKLSDTIGIQTVMISHHASDVVSSNNSAVVTVGYNKTGKIAAKHHTLKQVDHNLVADADFSAIKKADQDYSAFTAASNIGIKSIQLINAQAHTDTTINLSSGLTVINGGNDVGKSTIARTFKAFLENEFKAELINHDADRMGFVLTVEEDFKLSWYFSRKSKMSLYQLHDKDGQLIQEEEAERGVIPAFVNETLSMENVLGINLHIADQKDPLFILHPSISPSERAEMLNLGEDFRTLQIMLQMHAEELRENRREVKRISEQINHYNDALHYLSPLDSLNSAANSLSELNPIDTHEYRTLANALNDKAIHDNHEIALCALSRVADLPDTEPENTDLLTQLVELANNGDYNTTLENAHALLNAVLQMELHDEHADVLSTLEQTSTNEAHNQITAKVKQTLDCTLLIALKSVDFDLTDYVNTLNFLDGANVTIEELTRQLNELEAEKAKIVICDACGQAISSDNTGTEHERGALHSHTEKTPNKTNSVTKVTIPHQHLAQPRTHKLLRAHF